MRIRSEALIAIHVAVLGALVAVEAQVSAQPRTARARTLEAGSKSVVHSQLHSFSLETVTEGVEEPWSIAFLPDGRMLISERAGRLRIVEHGKLLAEPVAGTPAVWAKGQGGLLDIAVHPDYARNGWIYLTFSDAGSENLSMTAVARGRITEGRWTQQLTVFKVDVELHRHSVAHFGSRMALDKNDRLFFTIGDRGFSEDAQDLTRPNGKVHRIDDAGAVPFDNPFAGLVGGIRTIWTFGHRNPQGLAFHPVTGDLWEVEHGPRGGDELNRLQPGRNYGWPAISHGLHYDGTAVSDRTAREGMEQPVYYWMPSIGPSSMAFYTGDLFPRWRDHLFVTGLVSHDLRRLVIVDNRIAHEEILLRNIGRARAVVSGPDGHLYIVMNQPDLIARLVPASSRR